MKIDLHVHSRFSKRPAYWVLQKLGCAESYTDPHEAYCIAKQQGMHAVTLTDHNSIEGYLQIAHLPDTFSGCEVTTYFPEDQCKLHVLVYRMSEAQFKEIDRLRENIFELTVYLNEENIFYVLAHPFVIINDRLTLEHFEQCVLLFKHFELNGDRDRIVNDTLGQILTNLTPKEIDDLADRYGFYPAFGEPWRKGLIGGSDDHSSLSIAQTYTQVEGASTLGEFWTGLEDCRGRVDYARPSQPAILAHNLYGTAYQFYKEKFKLEGYTDYNLLTRFLDRMLHRRKPEEPRIWARIYSRWKSTRVRNISPQPGVMELLQYEAQKIISQDSHLTAVLQQGLQTSREPEQLWFYFINEVSNKMLGHLCGRVVNQVVGGNPFDLFRNLGSAGALYSLLAPYFIAFSIYSKDRQFSEFVARRFGCPTVSPSRPRVGLFTDVVEDVRTFTRGLAGRGEINRQKSEKDFTLLTCAVNPDPEDPGFGHIRYFPPIAAHTILAASELKVSIPPLLEIFQFCYGRNFTHIHAATPGPLGLAGLAVARIMKLPFYATYHPTLVHYARQLTGDSGLEGLIWSGLGWFYGQAEAVFVSSPAIREELIEKGIAEEKIKLVSSDPHPTPGFERGIENYWPYYRQPDEPVTPIRPAALKFPNFEEVFKSPYLAQ